MIFRLNILVKPSGNYVATFQLSNGAEIVENGVNHQKYERLLLQVFPLFYQRF